MWVVLLLPHIAGDLSAAGTVLKFARSTRVLRMFGKIGKVVSLVWQVLESTNSVGLIAFVKVGACLILVGMWCHVAACCWYFVGRNGWVAELNITTAPVVQRYMLSLSYAM